MMVPMQRLNLILGVLAALVLVSPVVAQEVVHPRVEDTIQPASQQLSLIHISEPTRLLRRSRMPSSA